VASIRTADDLAILGAAGSNTFTFNPTVAEGLFSDEQTAKASLNFEQIAAS